MSSVIELILPTYQSGMEGDGFPAIAFSDGGMTHIECTLTD
jgi:hypothetical protein